MLSEIPSFLHNTLTPDDLRAALALAKGEYADASVRRAAERAIERAATAGDALSADLIVHRGDLRLPTLQTGVAPFVGLLIVDGDLVVDGLFADSLDPDSTMIVTGDLRAERLISRGFLEVHGSVHVAREALWLDNDGCAEIFGELHASFLYTKYHSVRVHGGLHADLVLGDDPRFESETPYAFVDEGDDGRKRWLLARLPRAALVLEGDPDEDDEDDWCIDFVDHRVLRTLVTAGEPVLRPAP